MKVIQNPDDSVNNQSVNKNLNYMRQKMSKERMYELAMKKGVKADPKILELLKRMEESYKLKQSLKDFADKEAQDLKLKKMKDIREQVVIKTLALGVAAFNQKDCDGELIRPLDSVVEPAQEIQLIDMNSYEDHDVEAVNSLYKLYGKLFKTYFVTYSSGIKIIDKFTEETEQTITRSDLWAFLKDKKMEVNTNMEELGDLIRQINLIHFEIRGDPNNLSYKGYKIFMLEIAQMFFPSTIPMPPAFSLKRLLKYLESVDSMNEKISKIFDNPEYAGVDDYDLIKYLNEQVNKNPNMKIPESYSLNKRKIIDYEFKVSKTLAVTDSYKICTEILNDLISRAPNLDFDFIEPIPMISDKYYVKPKTFFKDALNKKLVSSVVQLQSGDLDIHFTKKKPKTIIKEPHFISENEKKIMFSKPLVELSTLMKYHVASYDMKDRAIAKDCAYVLEELLQKASEGTMPGEGDYHLKIPIKITIENDIIRARELSKMKADRKEIKEHEEFIKRNEELKDTIQKEKQRKEIEEEKKRKEEKKKQKELEVKRRKKEKEKKKLAAKLKKEVEKKEQREKKIKEEREKRAQKRLEEIEAKRKQKFKDFQEARIKAFKQQWRDKWLDFKKKQAQNHLIEQAWAESQKVENLDHLTAFKKTKDEMQLKKEHEEEMFKKFAASKEADLFKKKYNGGIEAVFYHYCKIGKHEIGHEECSYLLNKKELAKFSNHFSLYPALLTPYELNKWYNEVDLKEGIDKFGINLSQFENFLLEICFKHREFLSKFYLETIYKHDGMVSDGSKTENLKSVQEFAKKTDVGVMPSMRKNVDKKKTDDIANKSMEDNKKPKSAKSKKDTSILGNEDSMNLGSARDQSFVQDEAQLEEQMNAFEGLMLYMGITEDSKEMKSRLKDIYEHFHYTSSQKREMSNFELKIRCEETEGRKRHSHR